jgi:hypothetical protein
MNPKIIAYWDKVGVDVSYRVAGQFPESHLYTYYGKGHKGSFRCVHDGVKQLYWFGVSFQDKGEWYSEGEMLRLLRLKAFI